jgi:hypothetical protein
MEVLGVGPHETWIVGDNLDWEIMAPVMRDHLGRSNWRASVRPGCQRHSDAPAMSD